MDFIKIGEIINTFGIKGELKVKSLSNFEDERYKKGSNVYVGEECECFTVKNYKHHKGFTLVSFEGYEDINLVERLKNKFIYKAKEDIGTRSDGKHYRRDLIGLRIVQNNKDIGECIDVEDGLQYNYLRIKCGEGEKLVPFIETFIKEVNYVNKTIEIIDIEGLI